MTDTGMNYLLYGWKEDGGYVPMSFHAAQDDAEAAAQCMQRGTQIVGPLSPSYVRPVESLEREIMQLRLFKSQFCKAFHIDEDADFQAHILNAPGAYARELQSYRDALGTAITRADIDTIESWYFAHKDRCDGIHDTASDDALMQRLRALTENLPT